MADLKISQLTAVTTPLAETEVLPIVQSGSTKKVTVAELTTLIKHTMTMDNTNVLQFGVAGVTASINYNGDGSLRIKPRAGYPVQIDLANIKFSNAGYGVDFSANANAPGMTSELLNWYEEGTCSFTVTSTSGTITTASASAVYTRVGRNVLITGTVTVTTNGTGAGALTVAGLPFTPGTAACGVGRESVNNGKTCSFMVSASSTSMSVQAYDNTYPVASGSVIQFSVSYSV